MNNTCQINHTKPKMKRGKKIMMIFKIIVAVKHQSRVPVKIMLKKQELHSAKRVLKHHML